MCRNVQSWVGGENKEYDIPSCADIGKMEKRTAVVFEQLKTLEMTGDGAMKAIEIT